MTTFGHDLLAEWSLDPDLLYLNHGTVGATPRRVMAAQRRIQDEVERNPSAFMLRRLSAIRVGAQDSAPGLLRQAAADVGAFVGASGPDLVFVDNTTAGVNAILRSLDLRPEDEVVIADVAYGAVLNAATYAARERGARVVQIDTPEPVGAGEGFVDAFDRALTPRTRIAIVDHVTSQTALVLPLADIAARCRARGVLVLADGAHAPGGIPLDISALGVDFYVANLHKWAWAPRSCAILWAAKPHQLWLHPPVISWGLDAGFTTEFDWVGTRDASPFLAAPAAFRFMDSFGIDRVLAHNHSLAWKAGQHLAERWGTSLDVPEVMVGSMVAVPLPSSAGSTVDEAGRLRDALLFEDRIEVQVHAWRGRLWVRVSAQIYNDMDDIGRLAEAVAARLS